MNRSAILISALSGLTSLLLFLAGALSGGFAWPVLLLTPVTIIIASLGWGTHTGFMSAALATIACFFLAGPNGALVYLTVFGLPAAYLAHLLGLSRVDEGSGHVEWFPLGSIYFRAMIYGGVLFSAGLVAMNFDADLLARELASRLDQIPSEMTPELRQLFVDNLPSYIALFPYVMPMIWFFMIAFNVWLGARIVKKSENFDRPGVQLSAVDLPLLTLGLLAFSFALTFLSSPTLLIGSAFSGSLTMALTMLGFNTVHILVRPSGHGGVLLVGLYLMTLLLSIPLLILFILGIADVFLKIRQRLLAGQNQIKP